MRIDESDEDWRSESNSGRDGAEVVPAYMYGRRASGCRPAGDRNKAPVLWTAACFGCFDAKFETLHPVDLVEAGDATLAAMEEVDELDQDQDQGRRSRPRNDSNLL